MYFPDDDSNIENIDTINELCIICLESNNIISIKKNYKKYNQCECNYYIHNDCLEQWKNIKNKCPICHSIFPEIREEIEEEQEEECQQCYYLKFLELIFLYHQIFGEKNIGNIGFNFLKKPSRLKIVSETIQRKRFNMDA